MVWNTINGAKVYCCVVDGKHSKGTAKCIWNECFSVLSHTRPLFHQFINKLLELRDLELVITSWAWKYYVHLSRCQFDLLVISLHSVFWSHFDWFGLKNCYFSMQACIQIINLMTVGCSVISRIIVRYLDEINGTGY